MTLDKFISNQIAPCSFLFEKLVTDPNVPAEDLRQYADIYCNYHTLVSYQSNTLSGVLFRHLYYLERSCERAMDLLNAFGEAPYHLNASRDDILRKVGERADKERAKGIKDKIGKVEYV